MTFRRGPLRRGTLWVVVAGGWISVGGVALWTLAQVFEPGWSASKAVNVVAVAAAGVQLAYTISLLQRWNRNFAFNRLTIDDDGIRGQFTERKLDFVWADIKGVSKGNVRGAWVLETRRGPIRFSALDIPRPGRAARAIEERLTRRGNG